MASSSLTKRRFIGWFIVFTFGMAGWILPGDLGLCIGIGLMAFSNMILLSQRTYSRRPSAREKLWALALSVGIFFLMIAAWRWLPRDLGAPFVKAIRHPASVAVLWMVGTWLMYRQYKRIKSNEAPDV